MGPISRNVAPAACGIGARIRRGAGNRPDKRRVAQHGARLMRETFRAWQSLVLDQKTLEGRESCPKHNQILA